jgi:tRNA (guanine-N7-)-methyltransferase
VTPLLEIDPSACSPPFQWATVFGNANPVEVEIGCGKGMFLKEAARANPNTNYLGVERATRYLRVALHRLTRAGLANVRLMGCDGLDLLSRWVPPDSVHALHIYFPDPWPKRRHQKRRIFRPELLELSARALCPGGEFYLATDHESYGEVIRGLLAAQASRFSPVDWPEDSPDRFPTNYALKWRRQDRPLWWARYRFIDSPAASTRAAEGKRVPWDGARRR